MVYAPDSKSGGLNAHVGSSPTSGTKCPISAILKVVLIYDECERHFQYGRLPWYHQ